MFGLFPFRSPLLGESLLLSFPPGTKMVHFPGFASRSLLYSGTDTPILLEVSLEDSEIPGSQPVCGSPRLIAAYRVLRRLPSPRHPPCALSSLTIKFALPEIQGYQARVNHHGPCLLTRRYLIVKEQISGCTGNKKLQPSPFGLRLASVRIILNLLHHQALCFRQNRIRYHPGPLAGLPGEARRAKNGGGKRI
jgi:hypothetical protein